MASPPETCVLDALEEIDTCSICFNRFEGRDPRCLPCLHPFCKTCIQSVHDVNVRDNRSAPNSVRCPHCQGVSDLQVPIDQLPSFFHGNKVRDILDRLRVDHSKCSVCKKESTAMFCPTCCRTFCEPCQKKHDENSSFRDHLKIPIDPTTIRHLICATHDELTDAFCVDCASKVCRSCQFGDHSQHKLDNFCVLPNAQSCVEAGIAEKENEIIQLELNFRSYQTEFDAVADKTLQEISAHKRKMIRDLEEREIVLQSQLMKKKSDIHDALEERVKLAYQSLDTLMDLGHKRRNLTQPFAHLRDISVISAKTSLDASRESANKGADNLPSTQGCQFIPQTGDMFLGFLT